MAARPPLRSYALAGALVLFAAAAWRNWPHLAPGAYNWAESGNTAAALVEGRGFSDPFDGGTGATAWIPPGYVWLLAGVFALAGVKTAAAAAGVMVLTAAGLAAAHALLVACVPVSATWMRRATSVAFLGYATLLPLNPFTVMSEAWLNILLLAALLWAVLEHRRAPRPAVTITLVIVAALGPLTNAGLAVALGAVLLALFALEWNTRRAWRTPVLAAAAAAIAVGGWTARNALALGRFVPLKSNAWFELHLANVDADDGLPHTETVLHRLPFFNRPEFQRYAALGELAYVDSFRAPSLAAIRGDPAHFAGNIGRRLVNATVFLRLAEGSMPTQRPISPPDLLKLVQAGEILPLGGASKTNTWMRMDTPVAREEAALRALHLQDFPHLWQDWLEKREAYDDEHWGLRGLLASFLIAGAPTLALLAAALGGRGRLPAPAAWAALILAGMLLPFVLVNHSIRHQQPLIGLQAIAIGTAVEVWAGRWRERQRTTS